MARTSLAILLFSASLLAGCQQAPTSEARNSLDLSSFFGTTEGGSDSRSGQAAPRTTVACPVLPIAEFPLGRRTIIPIGPLPGATFLGHVLVSPRINSSRNGLRFAQDTRTDLSFDGVMTRFVADDGGAFGARVLIGGRDNLQSYANQEIRAIRDADSRMLVLLVFRTQDQQTLACRVEVNVTFPTVMD